MAQTTLDMDARTLQLLADLKLKFNVRTNAQVIRRALAIARIAAANADDSSIVTIVNPEGESTKYVISD